MKENRKLLREILNDIRHDMTDEEVLNLLADSKIPITGEYVSMLSGYFPMWGGEECDGGGAEWLLRIFFLYLHHCIRL